MLVFRGVNHKVSRNSKSDELMPHVPLPLGDSKVASQSWWLRGLWGQKRLKKDFSAPFLVNPKIVRKEVGSFVWLMMFQDVLEIYFFVFFPETSQYHPPNKYVPNSPCVWMSRVWSTWPRIRFHSLAFYKSSKTNCGIDLRFGSFFVWITSPGGKPNGRWDLSVQKKDMLLFKGPFENKDLCIYH